MTMHSFWAFGARYNVDTAGLLVSTSGRTVGALGAHRKRITPPPRVTTLVFDVTERCNMGCVYCYLPRRRRVATICSSTVRAALDAFGNGCALPDHLSIEFFGGEPLLAFEELRCAVRACEEVLDPARLDYTVFTNGTVLTRDIETFLSEHDFEVQISLDGPPSYHDAVRPRAGGQPSYSRVVRNALRLLERMPRHVRSAATIGIEGAASSYWMVYEHAIELGFTRASANLCQGVPALGKCVGARRAAQLASSLEEAAMEYLALLLNGKLIALTEFVRPMTLLFSGQRAESPWLSGYAPLISTTGDVYAWPTAAGLPEYRFGNVRVRVDFAGLLACLDSITNRVRTAQPCASCWASSLCGGYHVPFSRDFRSGMVAPSRQVCAVTRRTIECAAAIYHRLATDAPLVLRALVAHRAFSAAIEALNA